MTRLCLLLMVMLSGQLLQAQRVDTLTVPFGADEENGKKLRSDAVLRYRIFTDSVEIYRRIESFSKKTRITELLYELVFMPVEPEPVVEVKKVIVKPVRVDYSKYEGKVIRSINVTTYDPFGFDAQDTSRSPRNYLLKAGNVLHVKSRPFKIRYLMMVKKNDTFDSLRVKESERLIRSQNYVREVYVTPVMQGDSVDLNIRVYDVWSLIGTGMASTSNFSLDLREKNFMGWGHQIYNSYSKEYSTSAYNYDLSYFIPNIYKTYISSAFRYQEDNKKNSNQSISLDRPFYSALTDWAGGVFLQRQLNHIEMHPPDSSAYIQRILNNNQDWWVGRSWQLLKGKTENDRTTTLIVSGRYIRRNFAERLPVVYDTLGSYINEDFYLASVGVARRQYKRDNYIFNYGFAEDVPAGRAFSLIGGYQQKERRGNRMYAGAKAYTANYHSWGYFNLYLEYGSFFDGNRQEESNFTAGINYFSKLMLVGRWKLRQFIKPQLTIGFNRLESDNLTLNTDAGIRGFNSEGLTGTQKAVLVLQLQSYAPWRVLGFRFGPFAICSFGMLGNESQGFRHSPVYSQFGLGLLIKNEFLILSSFQISAAYYPVIPGQGSSIFKLNPVKTTDFGFRGFDITRPGMISYQ